MKISKRRMFLAGTALAVMIQTGTATAWAEADSAPQTVPPGWEGKLPISEPQQYPPFTVMEGFDGAIAFPQAPIVEQDILLVPARVLLERLGFQVQWNDQERAVVAAKEGVELTFLMDQPQAVLNGGKHLLPATARLVGETAYVPLRFTAEADKREVLWRSYNKQIVIRENNSLVNVRVVSVVDSPLAEEQLKQLAAKAGESSGLQLRLNALGKPNYQEKVNLMIAANDLPEMLLVPDPFFLQASLTYSVFWNLKPFLNEYPHLSQAVEKLGNQIVLEDGGVYGIPRMQNAYDGVFPAMRKDWLDRLDIKQLPHTMDELLQVMKDFEAKDPDGNGKRDTMALSGNIGSNGLNSLAWVENVFNESGGRYKWKDRRIADTWVEAGTKEALKWLSEAYASGLLAKDFPVVSSEQAKRLVTEDHTGVMAMTGQESMKVTEQLKSIITTANFSPLTYLQAKTDSPKIVPVSLGHSGIFAIPKSVSETKVKRILAFMEAWMSRFDKMEGERRDLQPLEPFFGENTAASNQPQMQGIWNQREQIDNSLLQDPTLGLFSNDMRAKLRETEQKLYQTKIKIILGSLPLNMWDTVVEEVKQDAVYQSVMKELNEKAARNLTKATG